MARRTLFLVLRFGAAFGLLAWLAAALPIYVELERPITAAANAFLRDSGGERRSLELVADDRPHYVYEMEHGEARQTLDRPMHAHGFIALIFASLVLATPGLGLRRLAVMLAIGVPLVWALCTLMLMSDVAIWETEGRAALGLPPTAGGPYGFPLGFVAGLHRTAAAGLLPIVLWVLLAVRPTPPRG